MEVSMIFCVISSLLTDCIILMLKCCTTRIFHRKTREKPMCHQLGESKTKLMWVR